MYQFLGFVALAALGKFSAWYVTEERKKEAAIAKKVSARNRRRRAEERRRNYAELMEITNMRAEV